LVALADGTLAIFHRAEGFHVVKLIRKRMVIYY